MPKWKDLTEKEKKERIEKTYQSIKDDEESVNFFDRFKEVNPDIEISLSELFEYLR